MRYSTFLLSLASIIFSSINVSAESLEQLLQSKGIVQKSAATDGAALQAGSTYYNKGTTISYPTEAMTASIQTFLQERYTFTDNDKNSSAKNTSSFSTERARLIISGTAMYNEFSYLLVPDFIGTNDTDGIKSPRLKDASISWHSCDCSALKIGQFKTPVSRQFNADDSSLQFADRFIISNFFDQDRQQGLYGFYKLLDGQLIAGAGVFNGISSGEGINLSGVDTKHSGVATLRYNPLGKININEEGDIDFTEDLALSFGAAYSYSKANQTSDNLLSDIKSDIVSVDANVKTNGASLHAEFFTASNNGDVASNNSDPLGFYLQGGYFLSPKEVEIAAKYAYLNCDNGNAREQCIGNDSINQATLGLNYYFLKHQLKAQLNYDFSSQDSAENDKDDIRTNRWIFQVSTVL